MKRKTFAKVLATVLAVAMLFSVVPIAASAVSFTYDTTKGDSYYNVISQRNWDLAPGILETEQVLNNAAGTRRQVVHTATVDLNNPYTKIIPGYKGMWPQMGNYGLEAPSVQALNAEKLGYGNVVAATNCCLSWYTEAYYKQHPEYIGQPLGYSILNGEYYTNSQGHGVGAQTVIVVNYDKHPITGEDRPADMPKVWIRNCSDPLTGWEEQAIPVLFTYLFRPDANGNVVFESKNRAENHTSGIASRTWVGVKPDGTFIVSVSDGEQSPYSAGFTEYEMADYMYKQGCVIAANADGGGSSTFCTQRPGEDLKVNCSLSDGGERPTTNTILIISTAPADGTFAKATISSDYDYYTPGSSVEFEALGTDAVGTKVDIPDDVEWTVKEQNMGTVQNGVFTSNGTEGKATVQMKYNGQVVGEKEINIATPEEISFNQQVMTVPFGKTVHVPVKATTGNGKFEIGIGQNDVTFTTDNAALGTFNGLNFTAVDEENAPANLTSNVTATLNMGDNPTASFQLNLGKGSQVLYDFEGGQADIDVWNVVNNRKNAAHWAYDLNLSLADRTNGKVHDGNYSMKLETNGLHSKDSHSEQYAWLRMGTDGDPLQLENARSVGFWMWVPEENIQLWVQGHYMFDSDGNGTFDSQADVSMMPAEQVYYDVDESGWYYLQMDLSQYQEVVLKYANQFDKDPADGMSGAKGEFWLAIVYHKAINNAILQDGSVNGPHTYYFDNFTVDYSEAVDDREKPEFGKLKMDGTDLIKRDVVTTTNNTPGFSAAVEDMTVRVDATGTEHPLFNTSGINASTAKAYIDGVEINASYADGVMTAGNVKLADGYHRVKFEITDNAGNNAVIIRVFKVESGEAASTINVVPDDPTLDRIPYGSIYWMNLDATQIETIDKVETKINLNRVNHWQLDHMELADGFTAEYTIEDETNTATITLTRTGESDQTGAATLAKLPVRILNFDDDLKIPGYNATTFWTNFKFWAQDMKMNVQMGQITHTNGTTSTFSNEEFDVDTETYSHMAGMDKAYFAEHGTSHVHTPVAIADKAPTCTQPGYTGRTFCEECNSVVDWGTTVPATGHSFVAQDGKLVCSVCGHESKASGLVEADGKTYYAVSGNLLSGWQNIDEEWYYFDTNTFAGYEGEQTADNGITFVFDKGRVTHGTWQQVGDKKRYWNGPGYYKDTSPETTSCRPYEIDGDTYLFDHSGYMQTGIHRFLDGTYDMIYFDCGTDGKAQRFNGVYSGTTFPGDVDKFFINGYPVKQYKLVELDGDFYFVNDGYKIARNAKLYLSDAQIGGLTLPDGRAILPGYHNFDADGKMIIEPVKNGVIDGKLYINDILQVRYQLAQFGEDYYFVNDGDYVAKNVKLYLSAQYVNGKKDKYGYDILPGTYNFDADGKMVQEAPKNGVVDGKLYIDNVLQTRYQLAQFGEDFYFVNDGDNVAKNVKLYLSAQYVNGKKDKYGYDILPGTYNFDADGKMVQEAPKNGVVDGKLYIDNVLQTRYQLAQFGEDFYFVNDGDLVAKNVKLYLSAQYVDGKKDKYGYDILPGTYNFDADGKMVQEAPKNGVVDGKLYIDNVLQTRYQLAQFGEDFYFVNDGDLVAKNVKLYLSAQYVDGKKDKYGYDILPGIYNFDADGKMVQEAPKNGVIDDYLYINNVKQTRYKLAQFEGDFYFINDGDKIAKSVKLYLADQYVQGFTLPDGSPLPAGTYNFGADGKMILN